MNIQPDHGQSDMMTTMATDPLHGIDFAHLPAPEPFPFDAEKAVYGSPDDVRRTQLQLVALARESLARFRYAVAEVTRYVAMGTSRIWRVGRGWTTVHCPYAWTRFVHVVFRRALEAGQPEACGMQLLIAIAEMANRNEEQRVRQEKRRRAGMKGALTRKARVQVDRMLKG